MNAIFLGIILIIGYYYQSHHPIRRLELIRSSGYHIYFKAGLSGFIFLTYSIMIWAVIDIYDIPSSIFRSLDLVGTFPYLENNSHWIDIKIILIFGLMFFLSFSFVQIRRILFYFNQAGLLKRIKKIAHELELLIIDRTSEVKPIRLELSCGKVYVGIPERPNLEKGELQFITLLPLLSGYVNEEKKIIFINNYYRHYEDNFNNDASDSNTEHSSLNDFSIILPVEEIVIASRFSIKAFIQFRNAKGSTLTGLPPSNNV